MDQWPDFIKFSMNPVLPRMLCRITSKSVGKIAKSDYCLYYVCLSVSLHRAIRLPLEGRYEIWNFYIFWKAVKKIQVLLKGMFQTNLVKKVKTDTLCSIIISGNRGIYEKMWKNMEQPDMPQMTIYSIAHALCMLEN